MSKKNDLELLIGVGSDNSERKPEKNTRKKKVSNVEKYQKHAPAKLETQVGLKENDSSSTTLVISSSSVRVSQSAAAAEERQRTGRYLAVGLTLVMCFIALYHTVMRQIPVLAGIMAPAIIMIVYVVWILYFAEKRKRQPITAI